MRRVDILKIEGIHRSLPAAFRGTRCCEVFLLCLNFASDEIDISLNQTPMTTVSVFGGREG